MRGPTTPMSSRRSLTTLALAALALRAAPLQAPGARVATVTPLKASGVYALGEKAGWKVGGPAGTYHYVLKRDNKDVVQTGDLDLATGEKRIEATLNEPAMLYLELTSPKGGLPATYGAAVAPRKLKPVVEKPKDFDAFWKRKLAELRATPDNAVLTPSDSYRPEVEVQTLRLDGPGGGHTYGALAKPRAPGKYPAIAVFQWASPPYPLQKAWSVEPAAKGFIVLNVEPHDVLPTEPPAYYQALPQTLKNYGAAGQQSRDGNYFVEMYLRDVRALDYLRHRPDWDGKTLVVMGGSMGGQQSLAAAGLVPEVTHLIVEEPAGCDLNAGLHGRQEGYPFYPVNDPKAMETARYIDAVNFAPRIRATSLVAMGFVDNVAPPTGIWTAFNLIRAPKEAAPMRDAPHNNYATPEQLKPISVRREDWLSALAKGEKVEIRKDAGRS